MRIIEGPPETIFLDRGREGQRQKPPPGSPAAVGGWGCYPVERINLVMISDKECLVEQGGDSVVIMRKD